MSDRALAIALTDACEWAVASGNDPRRTGALNYEFRSHLDRIERAVTTDPVFVGQFGKFIRSGMATVPISEKLFASKLFNRVLKLEMPKSRCPMSVIS